MKFNKLFRKYIRWLRICSRNVLRKNNDNIVWITNVTLLKMLNLNRNQIYFLPYFYVTNSYSVKCGIIFRICLSNSRFSAQDKVWSRFYSSTFILQFRFVNHCYYFVRMDEDFYYSSTLCHSTSSFFLLLSSIRICFGTYDIVVVVDIVSQNVKSQI